jgi:hypothetical protein
VNYNRTLALFLVLIFLITKVGLSLNLHYCSDELYMISNTMNPKGCSMKSVKKTTNNHPNSIYNKDCCYDKVFHLQNDETEFFKSVDFFKSKTSKKYLRETTSNYLFIFREEFTKSNYDPPPIKSKNLFKLYNHLIIYG